MDDIIKIRDELCAELHVELQKRICIEIQELEEQRLTILNEICDINEICEANELYMSPLRKPWLTVYRRLQVLVRVFTFNTFRGSSKT